MNGLKQIVIFLIVQLFFIENSCAQINLVKNSSFEDTIKCPDVWGYLDPYVYYWNDPTGCTSDYYNSCASYGTGCSVPANAPDMFQYPMTGNAYCGVYAYAQYGLVRDYVQGQLSDSMIAGEKYIISFHVSLANISRYGVNSFGAYLSKDSVSGTGCNNLPYSPQIFNSPFTFLKDTLGWMEISDDYTAIGGEKYITIGNFSNDADTDTLLFNNSPFGTAKIAYYYIDDVSVIKEFNIPTLIGGDNIFQINGLPEGCILHLYNSLGQIVYRNSSYNNDFNSIHVRSGIYYYHIELPNKEVYKGKLCIIY
jgi:hypothetical protein